MWLVVKSALSTHSRKVLSTTTTIVLLCVEVQKILNATGRHRTVTKNFLFSLKKTKQLDPKAVSP